MNDVIEFFTDPLRLILLVAGVSVVLAIIIFGRRSQRMEAKLYHGHSNREFEFNNPPPDLLVDEEVIVLPPRGKKSEEAKKDEKVEPKVESFSASEAVTEQKAESTIENNAETVQVESLEKDIPMATFEYPQGEEAVEKVAVEQEASTPVEEPQVQQVKPETERFIVFHVVPGGSQEVFQGKSLHQVVTALGLAFGKHNVYHFPADAAREGNSQFCLVNMTAQGVFDKDALSAHETRGVSLILRLSEETPDGLTLFSNMLAIAQGLARRLGGEIQDQTRVPLTPEIVTSLRSDIAQFHTQLNQRTPVTEI